MLRVESHIPFKPKSTFLHKLKKIPNLVFGVLKIEHDATVFALVSVVCHLEQIKHLLLNVECHFSYFTLCHDQVITVIDSVAKKEQECVVRSGVNGQIQSEKTNFSELTLAAPHPGKAQDPLK